VVNDFILYGASGVTTSTQFTTALALLIVFGDEWELVRVVRQAETTLAQMCLTKTSAMTRDEVTLLRRTRIYAIHDGVEPCIPLLPPSMQARSRPALEWLADLRDVVKREV
jgi:hypothetical protein